MIQFLFEIEFLKNFFGAYFCIVIISIIIFQGWSKFSTTYEFNLKLKESWNNEIIFSKEILNGSINDA